MTFAQAGNNAFKVNTLARANALWAIGFCAFHTRVKYLKLKLKIKNGIFCPLPLCFISSIFVFHSVSHLALYELKMLKWTLNLFLLFASFLLYYTANEPFYVLITICKQFQTDNM